MRYYINHDGEEKTYSFSLENQYVCNYESFLPQSPFLKIIQALENSEVLVISHSDLQLLYASVREGEHYGRIAIEAPHKVTDENNLNKGYLPCNQFFPINSEI